jgi:hypothetical protein
MLLAIFSNAFGAHLLVFYQQYFLETGVSGRWFGLALSLGSLVAVGAQLHAWRMIPRFGTRWGMILATGIPGIVYLLMALTTRPELAVLLFILQWGVIQLSGPLFSGLYNAEIPDGARATVLSLISGITTIYVGVMGILLGWLAEISMAWMFGLMGTIVLAGTMLVRLGPPVSRETIGGERVGLEPAP